MIACGISWCVALTDKQFCPIHEKNQALRPSEFDPEDEIILREDDAYDAGYAEGKREAEVND